MSVPRAAPTRVQDRVTVGTLENHAAYSATQAIAFLPQRAGTRKSLPIQMIEWRRLSWYGPVPFSAENQAFSGKN